VYLTPEDRRQTGLILVRVIRKNIILPALPRYASKGWIDGVRERAATAEVCDRLGVRAPSVETKVAKKVVLAKWLSLDPRVLIFDEPTRGIDVGGKAEIYELMRSLAERGIAILMVSSDMEEILRISTRVAVMHEGCVTGILNRTQCTEEAIMRLAVG
jgi:ribose transport system ATP-binding protein